MIKEKIVSSKGDFRRLVDGKAIPYIGKDESIADYDFKIEEAGTIRVGKKRFITISVS